MAATFVVEDGTGKTDANSYITEAAADQYVENTSGDAAWLAGSQADKEKALRLATQYIDNEYRGRWVGIRTNADQALAWPRSNAFDQDGYAIESDEMPQQLLDATVEMALVSFGGTELAPSIEEFGTIKKESDGVGPLDSMVEYMGGKDPFVYYRTVEDLLSGLTTGGSELIRS